MKPPPLITLTTLLVALLALPVTGCQRKGAKAFNQGQKHLAQKRYAKAIKSFEKATKQNPDFGEAFYNLGAARYQLAVTRLAALVRKHATPALEAALKPAKAGMLSADQAAALAALQRELNRLPVADADPIVALLRQALDAKLQARTLFKKGKFVVIRKSTTRRAMIKKLDEVVQLRQALRTQGESKRALWLAAVARPKLLTGKPAGKPQPRATGADKK